MSFALKSIILLLVYLAAAKIGLAFGTVSGNATVFWPPGGIALAALLLGGLRYLPAVFAGAYLAAVMLDDPLIVCLGTSLGNTLETFIGFTLLQRYGSDALKLQRSKDLFQLILLGGLIPAVASTILGPLSLLAAGFISIDTLPDIMWNWWRSDVLGVAFFTPLILVFAQRRAFFPARDSAWEIFALWCVSLIAGPFILLGFSFGIPLEHHLGIAWLFPLATWAGIRTGRRNTALIQFMFLGFALASAHYNMGIFADDFARYGMANFWMFAMLLAIGGMELAILSSEQRRTLRQMTLNAKVFTVSTEGIIITDADNNIVAANPACIDITGHSAQEMIGRNPRLLASGRQSREFYEAMWKSLNGVGQWEGEIWNRRKDGTAYLSRLSIHTLTDAHDKVINRIGIFSDITELRAAQDAVMHQAHHDCLTNLPNRQLFRDRFSQQLAIARRHDAKFAVIYLDLDDFKPVNDALGHQAGDQLLVAVADRLTSLIREADTVSRFGGDEFAILVSEIMTQEDVVTLADKILEALRQPFNIEGHAIQVSGSLGIALYPDHGDNMETIMNRADAAMYLAKKRGNDSFVIAEAV